MDSDMSEEEAELKALRQAKTYRDSWARKRGADSVCDADTNEEGAPITGPPPSKRSAQPIIVEDVELEARREQQKERQAERDINDAAESNSLKAGRLGPTSSEEQVMASGAEKGEDEEQSDSDGQSEADSDTDDYRLPLSQHATFQHGNKTVSSLHIDPSGARMVTGSYDAELKMWDFNGMDNRLKAFRTLQPCGNHVIRTVAYSNSGDSILVVPASSQAKLLTRDGQEVMECVKGDPYLTDMSNTSGHTGMLYGGAWHPRQREVFMTYGQDSTVRLWCTENHRKQTQVIKAKTQQGKKTIVTCAAFSTDCALIAAGTEAGGLLIWPAKGPYVSPRMAQHKAHDLGSGSTSLAFSRDSKQVLTRGFDDTLKLWDVRKLTAPVNVAKGLSNAVQETRCTFSPNDRLAVTGTSVPKGKGCGRLVMLDVVTFEPVAQPEKPGSSVVSLFWHPRLNQVACGNSDGTVNMYFDEKRSAKGALLCAARVVKRRPDGVAAVSLTQQHILTPHALPLFADKPVSKARRKEKDRKDPIKSHQPELPFDAKEGMGGRIAPNWTQWIKDEIERDTTRDEDPREAILRHAKAAEEKPFFVNPAYAKTQPKTQLAATVQSDEEEE